MSAPRRAQRLRVDGVLLLDKPAGLSSNGALMRVKRLYNAEKAGHTGTLDPLASGLLPLCFGEATKFAQVLLDAGKRYTAVVRFGITTTTQDREGDVVATRAVQFDRAALSAAMQRFTGRQTQVPPAHSALKHEGRPHYEYARAGIDIPRAPRMIEIAALRLLDWKPPEATLDVECSKGTYVRALAADLGEALGCGAHLAALRRTVSGPFRVDDAVTLEALEALEPGARSSLLLEVDSAVKALPRLDVDAEAAIRLRQGQSLVPVSPARGRHRCYAPTGFVGLVDIDDAVHALRLVRTG